MENNRENSFSSYSIIMMSIILIIEFILNIALISVSADIKNEKVFYNFYKKQYKEISASFSLFVICIFFFFLILLIVKCSNNYEQVHLILFIALFIICQLLYFIECMIIPIYLERTNLILKNEKYSISIERIKKKYVSLTASFFVFLFIIILLNLIVLNLFKGICCKMEKICNLTINCGTNFVRCFVNTITCITVNDTIPENIANLQNTIANKDRTINELTGDIKNLMAKNLDIQIKNSNI